MTIDLEPSPAAEKPRRAERAPQGKRPPRPLSLRVNSLLRWLHTYLSMVGLMAVLFFSVTGITLNHPDWTFGILERRTEVKGNLSPDWVREGAEVRKLEVVEHLRQQHKFHGKVAEYRTDELECSLSFKAPGYSVDGFIDRKTGDYQFTTSAEGAVAVLNDLHRGRNAGKAWAWLIDISAVMLVLVSITGVGMLLYLKRTRTSALWAGAAGLLVVAILMWIAI